MKSTDILRSEHEVILDVLSALESIAADVSKRGALDTASAEQALDFLCNFTDRCHHGKEEQLFFPALAARGLPREVGPLAVMLDDHEQGRTLLARMRTTLADAQGNPTRAAEFATAAQAYVALMRDHIDKENGVLFPMGDGMLNAIEQAALTSSFEQFEHRDLDAGAHAHFVDLAAALCARLHVDRAPRATATGVCCGHTRRA